MARLQVSFSIIMKQAKAAVGTTKSVYLLTKIQKNKTRQQPNLGRNGSSQ
jgi:hypothetical protein